MKSSSITCSTFSSMNSFLLKPIATSWSLLDLQMTAGYFPPSRPLSFSPPSNKTSKTPHFSSSTTTPHSSSNFPNSHSYFHNSSPQAADTFPSTAYTSHLTSYFPSSTHESPIPTFSFRTGTFLANCLWEWLGFDFPFELMFFRVYCWKACEWIPNRRWTSAVTCCVWTWSGSWRLWCVWMIRLSVRWFGQSRGRVRSGYWRGRGFRWQRWVTYSLSFTLWDVPYLTPRCYGRGTTDCYLFRFLHMGVCWVWVFCYRDSMTCVSFLGVFIRISGPREHGNCRTWEPDLTVRSLWGSACLWSSLV